MCPIPFLFIYFFKIFIVFWIFPRVSVFTWVLCWAFSYTLENYTTCSIYTGKIQFLLHCWFHCLFFLFALYFYFAAERNTGFGGVFFMKLKFFEVLKQHSSMILPNYYPQMNSNLLNHSAVSVSKPWKVFRCYLNYNLFSFAYKP